MVLNNIIHSLQCIAVNTFVVFLFILLEPNISVEN